MSTLNPRSELSLITRPMLAVDYDPANLVFPVLVSPKIDGLRCLKINGRALTRSFKEIPNEHVRRLVSLLPDGLDGELTAGESFRVSTSSIRTQYGQPSFIYHLFDYVEGKLTTPFRERFKTLTSLTLPDWCVVLPQIMAHSLSDLDYWESVYLLQGHEGVMLRKPDSPYKCNRSTLKEGYLLKVKRFADGEATIIGFFEQEENNNESYVNELGTTSRSHHQGNKLGKDTLGGLLVRDCESGKDFRIGTGQGWTVEWRHTVYHDQAAHLGRVIKYKHLPHGNYDVPRNASMLGFREAWDL